VTVDATASLVIVLVAAVFVASVARWLLAAVVVVALPRAAGRPRPPLPGLLLLRPAAAGGGDHDHRARQLVGARILSTLVYPLTGLRLRGDRRPTEPATVLG
jgi:hypothetical protein